MVGLDAHGWVSLETLTRVLLPWHQFTRARLAQEQRELLPLGQSGDFTCRPPAKCLRWGQRQTGAPRSPPLPELAPKSWIQAAPGLSVHLTVQLVFSLVSADGVHAQGGRSGGPGPPTQLYVGRWGRSAVVVSV